MEFTDDAALLTTWLAALFEDYSSVVNSFIKSNYWTYDGFEMLANDKGVNYIHMCSSKKSRSDRTEHENIMSNLIMDAAKRYWLHFPWIPLRPDEEHYAEPQPGPSTSASASSSGSSGHNGRIPVVDVDKVTEMRLKALVGGFYLVYYIYRTFPAKPPSDDYELVTIKIGREDIAKITIFKDDLLPMLKSLNETEGPVVNSTFLALNMDLIFRRAYKPMVGGGSFGIDVHHQVYLNMVHAKTMEFLVEDQDNMLLGAEVEKDFYDVVERETSLKMEIKKIKTACLRQSLVVKSLKNAHHPTDNQNLDDTEPNDADQMQLVVRQNGSGSEETVRRPTIKLAADDQILLETYSDMCHQNKRPPMHMSQIAHGLGPGATESGLIQRAKSKKLKFVVPRSGRRSERTTNGSGKVWGFVSGVPQPAPLAITDGRERLSLRGTYQATRSHKRLAITSGEDGTSGDEPAGIENDQGAVAVRGRGRPRGSTSGGRGQGRRGRGRRIASSAPSSREEVLTEEENDAVEQFPVAATRGRGRGRPRGSTSRGRGLGRRGRGRIASSAPSSRRVLTEDEDDAVEQFPVAARARGRGRGSVRSSGTRGPGRRASGPISTPASPEVFEDELDEHEIFIPSTSDNRRGRRRFSVKVAGVYSEPSVRGRGQRRRGRGRIPVQRP